MGISRRKFILGGLGLAGAAAVTAGGGGYWFVNQPQFGRSPSGERLKRCMASPHYVDGHFENLVPVSVMSEVEGEKESKFEALAKMAFGDRSGFFPDAPMLTKKTDLKALDRNKDCVVWMGHSTYFIQIEGVRILTDPVFSSYASPIWFVNKAFPGSNVYSAEDIPEIDVLAISHDHWDHLDYPSVMALKKKIKNIVCPLGIGEYFEQWGFDMKKLHEEDWDTEIALENIRVHILTSQHFSGRFLKSNPTQWGGFAFITKNRSVYYTGDGGYGEHFKAIGKKFGGFDMMLAECGQYNLAWHPIHMLPEETAQAAADVGAKRVIPAHGGKFALARHVWQEPYRRITEAAKDKSFALITPLIGEAAEIDAKAGDFEAWWERKA